MAVLKPPNSASLFTFRAAEWAVQVNTGTVASPNYEWLRGLSKFEPVNDATMQDDTDIDSGGYGSELVTAQKLNVNAEGLVKGERSASTVVPDPGVAFLRAKGKNLGYDNIVQLRYWRTDDLPEAYEHFFAVKWSDVGGGNADLQKFTATLSGRGEPTAIAKPQATDVNEIQLITVVGDPTAGGYVLGVLGDPTSSIAYNAADTAVEAALEALPSVGTGNVTVSGPVGGPYACEFLGDRAGVDVPQIEVVSHTLTGGTDPHVEVQTVQQGYDAP
ncbi:phage tail tube protein [Nocardia sp. NPDC057455]|uniref:phage tail tube protein n=1 Tax=Nocardia sp. NPDC057455 TaxID=3346138 RepID=UPI0036728BBA